MAIKLLEIRDATLVPRLETPKFRDYWYPQGNLFKVQNSWVSDPRSLVLSLGICFNTLRQTHFLQFFFLTNKQYSLHYNPGCIWNKYHETVFPHTISYSFRAVLVKLNFMTHQWISTRSSQNSALLEPFETLLSMFLCSVAFIHSFIYSFSKDLLSVILEMRITSNEPNRQRPCSHRAYILNFILQIPTSMVFPLLLPCLRGEQDSPRNLWWWSWGGHRGPAFVLLCFAFFCFAY